MKKIFFTFISLIFALGVSAQLTGSGYYRVTNSASGYYAWMVDKTGGINGTTAQMYAMQLWPSSKRDPICEPQTVIYVKSLGNNYYDLEAQGTSLTKVLGSQAKIVIKGNDATNKYMVSGEYMGQQMKLYQEGKDNSYGYRDFATSGSASDYVWSANPISASSANYVGLKPTLTVGNKKYAPFYASFPFKFYSKGMKAYYITKVATDDNIAVLKEVTTEVIPGETPLLIECAGANTADNKLDLLYGDYAPVSGNVLSGNYFCCDFIASSKSVYARTEFDAKTMRVWNVNKEGKLVLSTATDNLHKSVKGSEAAFRYLNANESYLKVATGTAAELQVMTEAEYAEFVKNKPVPVTGISVSAAATSLYVGESTTVSAAVTPADATNAELTWSSSNTAVATVDQNGNVKAVGKGTATITATAKDGSGVKGSVSITVQKHSYTITFQNEDGTTISSQTMEEGSAVTAPAAPAKTGYTFAGWTPAVATTVTGNATYKATYTVNSYTVTYVADGKTFKTETYAYGAAVTPIAEVPSKTGYTFKGWTAIPSTMPANNVTVTANFEVNKWTITYTVDGATYKTVSDVAYGTAITPESQPVKEGYTFSGWQNVPATMPDNNVTISGTFSINSYKVTYTVDGKAYETQTYKYGEAITVVAEPKKEGYTFSGWGEVPAKMGAADVTIAGTFTANDYTITYKIDGEVYKTEVYACDADVKVLAAPEAKTGYTFSGWEGTVTKMPAHDVEVVGSYVANKYNITYYIGSWTATETYAYGDSVIAPADAPEREGYHIEWPTLPETMPANNISICMGEYVVNYYTITYYVDDEVYHVDSIQYDTRLTSYTVVPVPADREGYDFSGWVWSEPLPRKMPAHDIEVRGTFTSGIEDIVIDFATARYYTIDGKPLAQPKRGLNIVKDASGKTYKIRR